MHQTTWIVLRATGLPFLVAICFGGLISAAPPVAPEPRPSLVDDDPLPAGAIARLGTTRYRSEAAWWHSGLSDDGKSALLTDHGGASLIDLATGKTKHRFPLKLKEARTPPPALRLCGNAVLGSNENTLFVWDATTGKLLHEYSGEPFKKDKPSELISLNASNDGSVVAFGCARNNSAGRQREVGLYGRVWVITFGAKPDVREFRTGYDNGPGGGALTPDGKTLVTCGPRDPDQEDTKWDVDIWDVPTGKLRHRSESPSGPVGVAEFTRDGTRALVAEQYGHGLVWDITTGKCVCKLEYHHPDNPDARYGMRATISPDGKAVAYQYRDRSVQVWDAVTGKKAKHYPPFSIAPTPLYPEPLKLGGAGLQYAPDGQLVGLGGFSGGAFAWDVERDKLLTPITGFPGGVHWVTFGASGRELFAMAENRSLLWRWALDPRPVATNIELQFDRKEFFLSYSRTPPTFSADGTSVAIPHHDFNNSERRFAVFSLTNGKEIFRSEILARGNEHGPRLAYSPDGKWIVWGGIDGQLGIGDKLAPLSVVHADTGKRREGIKLDALPYTRCAFSSDSRRLVAVGVGFEEPEPSKRPVPVWSLSSWDLVADKPLARGTAPGPVYLWTGVLPVIAPDDRTLVHVKRVKPEREYALFGWDILDGKATLEHILPLIERPTKLVVAPRTGLIAIAAEDAKGEPIIWVAPWPNLKQFKMLRGHRQEIRDLAFSPDGKTLASGSRDSTVLLWDVSSIRP